MKSNLGKSAYTSGVGGAIALCVSTVVGLTTLPAQSALLVSSSGDNSIKQYDETTGAYIRDFVTSGSGGLFNPQGLTLGPNGNLFVASGDSVKEYSGTTGEYIKDFAGSGLSDAKGLSFAPDGSLFVVSDFIPGTEQEVAGPNVVSWSSGLLQYDGTTGELIGNIPTGGSGRGLIATGPQPVDVVIGGPDNNLFISSGSARFNSGGIGVYDSTTRAPVGGLPNQVSFLDPGGLAVDDSDIFYTNFSTSVGRADLATGIGDSSFIGSGELNGAEDVTIGSNGNLFVSDFGSDSIKQYDRQTGDFLGDFVASGSGGLSAPTYVTTANVPVPEPSSVLGVLAFGGLFAGGALRRKRGVKLPK
ncbi:PEP-CTERM sorting domain-containing protein [Aliterella atlantica]|uniref:Ice-binding protein C-terminal domain-containing protein n=1 Tax=Aliterella atlantica CENA595 TaxID=1618023 RepID=A0A0D8ZTZ9_9CYAN|nr:PEP-CTERM sorting domain-containing protein [Aliterella atlantica]KJH70711.1 hypothetical protein UH38_16830 [Aliterella atlantica CENA595]